jgi:hypothetical protein
MKAVYNITEYLLNLNNNLDKRSLSSVLVKSFIKIANSISLMTLLKIQIFHYLTINPSASELITI